MKLIRSTQLQGSPPKVFSSSNPKIYRELQDKAFEMRENPTEAEAILWQALKGKKLGFKFRQQHVINQFIVDFYCLKKSLVIEVDGPVHQEQQERDCERDEILAELGCTILRFTNQEVLENLEEVLKIIKNTLISFPLNTQLSSPL